MLTVLDFSMHTLYVAKDLSLPLVQCQTAGFVAEWLIFTRISCTITITLRKHAYAIYRDYQLTAVKMVIFR